MLRLLFRAARLVSLCAPLAATAILASVGCSESGNQFHPVGDLGDFASVVEEQMRDWHVPGLAIGVVKDGEVIFAQGFGYRDREQQTPVTPRTMFPIASCSKAFTALSAAMAVEEGILDMDVPIKQYVPDFQLADEDATTRATLRDFLQHRSGLSGYRHVPMLSGANRDEVFQRLRYFEPTYALGEAFVYSNLGYTVAGHVVEKASGMKWEEYVAKRIFEPLGMNGACFTVEDMTRTGNFAEPYMNIVQDEPDRWPITINTAMAPAGGIVANLEDMLAWLRFQLSDGRVGNRQLISPEIIRVMRTSHSDTFPDSEDGLFTDQGYGLGWHTEKYRDRPHIYHGGLYDGYISWVDFLPEDGIGVVVLTNMYYHHLHSNLAYQVYDRLLGLPQVDHHARELETCGAGIAAWRKGHNAFWDDADPATKPLHNIEDYEGAYSNPLYGQVTVEADSTGMSLTFATGVELTLRHFSGETFATGSADPSYTQQILSFESNETGTVDSFSLPLDGIEAVFHLDESFDASIR